MPRTTDDEPTRRHPRPPNRWAIPLVAGSIILGLLSAVSIVVVTARISCGGKVYIMKHSGALSAESAATGSSLADHQWGAFTSKGRVEIDGKTVPILSVMRGWKKSER